MTTPRRYSWLANLPIHYKILLAIGSLLSLFLLDSLVNVASQRLQSKMRRWTDHTYQVLLQIDALQRTALSGESGLRGFALTHDSGDLIRITSSNAAFADQLTRLRQLTTDNPLQQSRIDRVGNLFSQWNHQLQDMFLAQEATLKLDNSEAIDRDAAIRAHYFAHRTVRMEDYTSILDDMSATERELLAARSSNVDRILRGTHTPT